MRYKMKVKVLLASLLVSAASLAQAASEPVIIKSPCDYQVLSISQNGKWACGVYNDYSYTNYGFLWNLESDEITMLSGADESEAWSVSDNGVVAGMYTDYNYNANGSKVSLPGYYANGKWNRLELPQGTVASGIAYAITPDGHYISGTVQSGSIYQGYIWKDGKIDKTLMNTTCSMPYAIAPDGQSAAGWIDQGNRAACYWNADGGIEILSTFKSPWSTGRKFSPDGKKLLFWGGWEGDDDATATLKGIYDIETKTISTIAPVRMGDFDLYDISNSYTVVGQLEGRGYINYNGTPMFVEQFLTERGVDLAAQHVLKMDGTDYFQVYRAQALSADDNVMAVLFYNDDKDSEGNLAVSSQSMIIKFNQASTGLSPVSVKASQCSGISSVNVSWKANVAAKGISGYNIYRDGTKVNANPVTETSYIDADVPAGNHEYSVTALYGETESDKSEAVAVEVASKTVSAPSAIFATQRGYSSAYAEWTAPQTNFASLTYYDANNANLQGFGVNATGYVYENAIRFDKSTVSAYKGQKITAVGFCPMSEQTYWKINLYTYDNEGALKNFWSQKVTQQLVYGERNVVVLEQPQDMPDGELLVAVEVSVGQPSQNITGMDYGRTVHQYSDLLRLTSEPDFYSVGNVYQSQGSIYSTTWNIDAVVAPADADLSADKVDHYVVYADGSEVGTSEKTSFVLPSLSEGKHDVGVSAVFANNAVSPVSTTSINVTPKTSALKAVDEVSVSLATNTVVDAKWQTPVDLDNTTVTYSGNVASNKGVYGPQENNYALMAGAIYTSKMFRGYNGYVIRAARFYPTADAVFTILIYKDGVLVCEKEVDDYTLGKWNVVKLDEEIAVDPKSSYRLVVDCYDVTPNQSALAVDKNSPVTNYSDLYSLDGESWASISDAAIYANWMIGLDIESTTPMQLPVAGYDVRIDGEKKNEALVKDNSFTYDFGTEDAVEHTVNVDVYYTVSATAVAGGATRFYIGVAGIADNVVDRIVVRQGDNELTFAGASVASVELVSASGAVVASAKGNTVSLNGVAAGVYVAKALVAGKTLTRKVQIVR